MKSAVVVFPGSNCDRDCAVAVERSTGSRPAMVWHGDAAVPASDVIVVPGGFSYGDYLRCGAMAARSPVIGEVVRRAEAGVAVLGVCNGFQILAEAGLLPGALIRNAGLGFVCRHVELETGTRASPFTAAYGAAPISLPVAHHDGNYVIDRDGLARLEDEDRIAFRYRDNPNGSTADIAGVLGPRRNVLGLMPHPERAIDPLLGGTDGLPMFRSLLESLA